MKNLILFTCLGLALFFNFSTFEESIRYVKEDIKAVTHSNDLDDKDIIETFEFYGNCDYVYLIVYELSRKDSKHTGKYMFRVIKGTSNTSLDFLDFTSAIREIERSIVNCEDLFPYNIVLKKEKEDNCYSVNTDYEQIGRFCPLSQDEHSGVWYFEKLE